MTAETSRSCSYLALWLALASSTAFAESRAVVAPHFQIGANYADARMDNDGTARSLTGTAGVTLPLAKFVGATASGFYSRHELEIPMGSCKANGSGLGGTAFLRDFDAGRAGISYTRQRSEFCGFSSMTGASSTTVTSTSQTAYATYYFPEWSVGASRSRFETADIARYGNTYSVSYYAPFDASFSLSASRSEGTNSYSGRLGLQPEFLQRSASLGFGYASSSSSHQVMVFIDYYFDQRVALKTRDRQYR